MDFSLIFSKLALHHIYESAIIEKLPLNIDNEIMEPACRELYAESVIRTLTETPDSRTTS
jgi:hypothetical protein